jgi:hypothetical protein
MNWGAVVSNLNGRLDCAIVAILAFNCELDCGLAVSIQIIRDTAPVAAAKSNFHRFDFVRRSIPLGVSA